MTNEITAKDVVELIKKCPDFKHTTDGVDGCIWTRCRADSAELCQVNRGEGFEDAVYTVAEEGNADVVLMAPYFVESEPNDPEFEWLLLQVGDFFYLLREGKGKVKA